MKSALKFKFQIPKIFIVQEQVGLHFSHQRFLARLQKKNAMILTAAYMNTAGYPKRAVRICEKYLKKQALSPGDIVPVLANAYHLQGKEKEAEKLEQTLIAPCKQ